MSTTLSSLDAEARQTIHKALLIGLTCYGEIEERLNVQDVREKCGNPVPEDLCVVHPTGCADVTSIFAAALICISSTGPSTGDDGVVKNFGF